MSLRLKIWLILGLVILAISGVAISLHFRAVEADANQRLHQQALDLRATLMATRRVYHKQFIDSGVPLDDRTLGFLPAHAMSRIAQDFPNWTKSGVRFNNVSDTPRNPVNLADADELAAMAWFRANPHAEEYTARLKGKNGAAYFYFAAPIWTEPYCLNCHASRETAPPAIQQLYSTGFGYQTGDLRGLLSIHIPVDSMYGAAIKHWQNEVAGLLLLLLALFAMLGLLLNHFLTRRLMHLAAASKRIAEGDYSARATISSKDEIGVLAHLFNTMAEAVEYREQSLRDSQLSYRILAEYSWNWDYWLGADGRYRYVSPACEQITGYPPADFISDASLFERLLHADDLPVWQQHLAQDRVLDRAPERTPDLPHSQHSPHAMLTLRIRAPDGRYHWIEHACIPIFDATGAYLGQRGVNQDIDARKRAEELEHYSAFQAGIADMSTSVLHNIGNAITAVTQHAEAIDHAGGELARVAALLENNASSSRQEIDSRPPPIDALASLQCAIQFEAASAIRRLSEHTLRPHTHLLRESVQHIAGIVRIQQSAAHSNGQLSSFSLAQAMRSVLEMLGEAIEKRDIEVAVTVQPSVDQVTLPHNRLLQALVNAILNAIESIDARRQNESFQGRLRLSAEALGGDQVRITLDDNGNGVDPSSRQALFRFGYSTKHRGSGFGLHSVAMFAQELGGQVALHSEGLGQGACLELILPLRPAPETAAHALDEDP